MPEQCSECDGKTIKIRGSGWDIEVWVCPNKDQPGHLTKQEAFEQVKEYVTSSDPHNSAGRST